MKQSFYYLIENHEPTGPHSLRVLRQKAEVFQIDPETPAKPSHPENALWSHIYEIPELHAELFPPKTTLPLRTFAPPVGLSATEARHEAVDIESMLHDNALRQLDAEGFDPGSLPIGPRQRRNRRFLITVLVLNVPAFLAFSLTSATQPYMVLAPTVALITTIITYWFMYHLMS